MGCCASTNGSSRKQENFEVGSECLKPKLSIQESRAPPPSAEEETVKEVLSETSKFKLSLQEHHVQDTNKNKIIHIDQKPFLDDEKKKIKNHQLIFQEEEETIVSEKEVSEVCSLSMSMSMSETVSTTTFNKRDDNDDDDEQEVEQRVRRSPVSRLPRNRQVSGDFGSRKDRVVGKSPTRRTEQSPAKRNNVIGRGVGGARGLVQSKESGNYQAGKRGLRSDPTRKDPGEGSGRRSRSPATNRSIMGRKPSVRRTIGSPGLFRTDSLESGADGTVESSSMEGKWTCTSSSSNVGGTTTANESLENPLVSLECFIFL